MAKTYKEEGEKIIISESITQEKVVNVEDLKMQHDSILKQIEQLKEIADEITDELQGIDDNTDVKVEDIPEKLSK